MRVNPQFTYPIIGALLGFGAPIGSFVLRVLLIADVRQHPFADLRANAFFYLYELFGTSLVFMIVGRIAGRRADRLRRGEAFYHELADHDALTGLYNARALTDRYRRALERAAAARQPLAMILLDVDGLKAINDAHGHAAGSKALVHVADALQQNKRAADIAARWGGDEFAILLEGADVDAATRVAEGVLTYLRITPLQLERATVMVTVTIGICAAAEPVSSSDLFEAADAALMTGKRRGRNTLEVVSI